MAEGGRRAVLVGAGHAHLHTLKRAAELVRRGHPLTVVAPETFWYSGLATGVLGGHYPPELDQVDVEALTERGGGRFLRDRMVGIDLAERLVRLEHGPPVPYDVLSLTLGSEPPSLPGEEDVSGCYRVKPVRRLAELRRDLERRLAAGEAPRVVVAGGGVTAGELAANIEALGRKRRGRVAVTVLGGGSELLRQLPRSARPRALAAMERRGVTFRRNARVARVEAGRAELENGDAVPFDFFVNATGLKPNPLLRQLGLPVDAEGGLVTDRWLRSRDEPSILAAGDCIAFQDHELPKVGVYAIREAPVLFDNILAMLEDRPLRSFRPQRHYLWIMNLGDGTGLAVRGGWWWHGRSAFWLKDRIDRRFLHTYQAAVQGG